MADAPVVHIGENSPEQVAYRLLRDIAFVEKRALNQMDANRTGTTPADRAWILDTYRQCLRTVRGQSPDGRISVG
jgi:hypothetical protein